MRRLIDHAILTTAAVIMAGPLLLVFFSAASPSGLNGAGWTDWSDWVGLSGLRANIASLDRLTGAGGIGPPLSDMIVTSLAMGAGVALLATGVAFSAAYAMVFLPRRGAGLWFGLTLLTLYFPVEARMLPTFDVAVTLGLTNTLAGLVLPVLPLALATLVFRQHLRSMPPELLEAARLDGAGPLRFLRDMVLPLSLTPIGAVLVITFLLGWNQYLWPLMISIDNAHFPLMRGLNLTGAGSGASMVLASVSILPPVLLVLGFLRLMSRVTAIRI